MLVVVNELLKMTFLTHETAIVKYILQLEDYWRGRLKIVRQIIQEENESKNYFKKLIWFFLLMKVYKKIIVATYIFPLLCCFPFRAVVL